MGKGSQVVLGGRELGRFRGREDGRMELVAALKGGRGHCEKAKDKGVGQLVKCLPRRHGALHLTPTIIQITVAAQAWHKGGGGTQDVEAAGFPRVPDSVSEQQTNKNLVSSS